MPRRLTESLKNEALRLGFDSVGVCPAVAPPGSRRLDEWLDAGYHGTMDYMARRREAYRHPRHVLDGARSVVMLTVNYRTEAPADEQSGRGRIARYAWGADYHDLLRDRLNRLAEFHQQWTPDAQVRGVVDTAPLLEREFARLAGLGWIGKNTMLLNRRQGSWFFLAALLTSETLQYDEPYQGDYCGTCRACLDACPTGAFVAPYQLDARRCISYLTIERKPLPPDAARQNLGSWLFGCDVCQEVCPWNRKAPTTTEDAFWPREGDRDFDLADLFSMDDAAWRTRFRHTPLWRPRRRGMLRNAAILLGGQRQEAALPALCRGLHDEEPVVRAACAWALGQLAGNEARAAILDRRPIETDATVLEEIDQQARAI